MNDPQALGDPGVTKRVEDSPQASIPTPSTGGSKRWFKVFVKISVVLLVVVGSVAAAGWYYMFGQTGEQIASNEIEYIPSQQEVDWNRSRTWFDLMVRQLRRTKDLRGVMHKQELIDGRLEPVVHLDLKVRKQPKSIYLRWRKPFSGREVIFERKKRRNRLIAHEGGALRPVSPDVIMALDHALAMKFSRHPIEELSLQYIIQEMPKYLADAENKPELEIAVDEKQTLKGRDCVHIQFRYPPGTDGPSDYRRFDVYIALDDNMPLRWERYGPPVDGEDVLLEYFELVEYERNVGLSDEDFEPSNEAYNFNAGWVMEL